GYFVINQSDISLFNKSAHNNSEINNDDNFNSDNNSEKMINKTTEKITIDIIYNELHDVIVYTEEQKHYIMKEAERLSREQGK
ncbi:MAG TPA: hypothetical protein GX708_16320, partial [Gallicola sp.]|nr:hypothetical protein [Gallicola sp.]